MGKVIMICAIILLGFFAVLVINNNVVKPKPATQNLTLNISSLKASPSPAQIINLTPAKTSSPSSQMQTATVIVETSKGNIELNLYAKDAPNTVANFIKKAQSGFYNNLIFHRVEDWVIQGGDPLGNGTGGGNMPVEFNSKPFIVGSLGIASHGDGKVQNDAQFFIVKTDAQFLNGKYTNFGIVTKGMDVVNKISIGDKILGITIE